MGLNRRCSIRYDILQLLQTILRDHGRDHALDLLSHRQLSLDDLESRLTIVGYYCLYVFEDAKIMRLVLEYGLSLNSFTWPGSILGPAYRTRCTVEFLQVLQGRGATLDCNFPT